MERCLVPEHLAGSAAAVVGESSWKKKIVRVGRQSEY